MKFKGRLQPGKMLLVDLRAEPHHSRRRDQAAARDRGSLMANGCRRTRSRSINCRRPIALASAPITTTILMPAARLRLHRRRHATILDAPMAVNGEEPVGSMGTDTPLACLSDKPQPLFNYFKQLFAQVTNPPIDPIREELVMSLTSYIGNERNILDETPQHCHTLKLDASDPDQLRPGEAAPRLQGRFPRDHAADAVFRADGGEEELERALDGLCRRASLAIKSGYTLLILSDRGVDERLRADPEPAGADGRAQPPGPRGNPHAGGADHRIGRAARGDALLPADRLRRQRGESVSGHRNARGHGARGLLPPGVTFDKALKNYKKAINKGLLKVFSKMGISTLQSYRGAQIFEAIGLNKGLVEKYFTGTPSRIEGVGLDVLAREAQMKHDLAFRTDRRIRHRTATTGGNYQYRVRGEYHLLNPLTVSKLQHAVQQQSFETFKEYTDADQRSEPPALHACAG